MSEEKAMDETAQPTHEHWWQIAPYEWREETLTPTEKRLTVALFLRHCVGCGLAVVVLPSEQDAPASH